jgi:hypothetical protein
MTKSVVTHLVMLLVGILVGVLLPELPRVIAQQQSSAKEPPKAAVEEITPGITAPSAAFGTLLAGRIAGDEITSRGIDLVKLHENTLNLLARKPGLFSKDELEDVIVKARVLKPLRVKEPAYERGGGIGEGPVGGGPIGGGKR